MTGAPAKLDCLIVGNHPCSYFAAAMLRNAPALSVVHAISSANLDNRLVLLNPAFFSLHPMLEHLMDQVPTTAIFGLTFLSDKSGVASEHRHASPMGYICDVADLTAAMAKIAGGYGSTPIKIQDLPIHNLDEQGAHVSLNGNDLYPSALMLADEPDGVCRSRLGLDDSWGPEVLYRFTSAEFTVAPSRETQPLLRMSLDVKGSLAWGWLLIHKDRARVVISQSVGSLASHPPEKLLAHWIQILQAHGDLPASAPITNSAMHHRDLPLAGALSQEGVANRTLLIGPAGGFYSACGEDIYPNCWSAVFATEVLRSALQEKHLQDAINTYRMNWRTTLGDYLRGPQQNLRFLLPLIYRNQVMTSRLAESILLGRKVVR